MNSPTGAPYRNVEPGSQLSAPPRQVPGRLALRLLLGGAIGQSGWFALLLAAVLSVVLAPCADLSRWTLDGPFERSEGEVTRVERTSMSENNRRVHEVAFVFAQGERRHIGASYTLGRLPAAGELVPIELPVGQPEHAVIVGMRRRPFGAPLLVVPLVAALAGLGLAGYRLRRGRRDLHLLRVGRVGAGKLVHNVPTRMRVNNRPVHRLSFDFEDHRGRVQRVDVHAHDLARFTDEALEPLVFDPVDPRRAALLDALPGTPRVTADGGLAYDASSWGMLATVGLPLLVLAAFAALVLLALA